MTEELEFLKHSGGVGGVGSVSTITDKNWRNRRSQKLDKMELLNLQSSLQSEIQAKQAISEELTKTRSDLIASQKYVLQLNNNDNKIIEMFFLSTTFICRELRDFKQRLDCVSHEMKRKELQIKELQTRLETGDSCKYPPIESSTTNSRSILVFPQSFGNLVSLIVLHTAVIHAALVVCKNFNFFHGLFRK